MPTAESDRPALRVALVSARFLPLTGGTEMHVAEIAPRLAMAGFDVEVVTTQAGDDLESQGAAAASSYRVSRLRTVPKRGDLYMAPGLVAHLSHRQFDLVHVQGIHTFFAPLAMLAAIGSRTPFVVTFHTGGHPSGLRTRLRRAQWRLLRPLLRRARALIAVSEFERSVFSVAVGVPPRRIHVIPNGAGLTPVRDAAEIDDLIVSVGRLETYKGHHRVIHAMPALIARRPDARLLILGDGSRAQGLRSLATRIGVGDRVEIRAIAPSERRTMAELVGSAALVVLLSEYEAHPLAVVEALALRRRVLVADTSGLSEIARAGLASAVDVRATSATIAAAMDEALRRPAPDAPIQLPTWDDCATEILGVYRSVLRRPA